MRIVSKKAVEKFLELAQSRQEPSGRFTYGNTTIIAERHPVNNSVIVYMKLYGNSVASAKWTGPTLRSVEFTLADWPTATTKERINALLWRLNSGCTIYTEDFQPYIRYRTRLHDDIHEGQGILDSQKWYTLVRHTAGGYIIDFTSLDTQDQEYIRQTVNSRELVEA